MSIFANIINLAIGGKKLAGNNPLPVNNTNVVAVNEIDIDNSNSDGWTGSILNLFDGNKATTFYNDSTDNPKEFTVKFKLAIQSFSFFLATNSGSFKNVRIYAQLGDLTEILIYDDSLNSTTQFAIPIEIPEFSGFGALRFQFLTSDTITLDFLNIGKYIFGVNLIRGSRPDGTFVNAQFTQVGDLKITDAESGLAIAKGEVIGSGFIHKFGKTPDFDIADGYVTIWDGANKAGIARMLYTYSTSAIIDSISSSENSDTQNIEILGLDSNYEEVIQTIELTGQTRKALTTNLIRITRLINVDSVDLAGNLYCYENTALNLGVPVDTSKVRAVIYDGNNQTLMATYTVPAGKTAYLRDMFASVAGGQLNSTNSVRLFVRPFGQVFQLKYDASLVATGTSTLTKIYSEPEVIQEKSDIEMRVNTSSNGSGVSGGFDIVLVDNTILT